MSASNEWFDYHLTPHGWESGSEKTDFGGTTEKEVPPDRVLTVRQSEYMASTFSPLQSSETVTWKTNDAVVLAELVEKFGDRPGKK